MSKLPSKSGQVFRGVKKNLLTEYKSKYNSQVTISWNSFSSTTSKLDVLETDQFLGTNGERTLFIITTSNARDISGFSLVQSECESLLPPLSTFEIGSILKQNELTIISLKEIDPIEDLIGMYTKSTPNVKTTSSPSPILKPAQQENLDSLLVWEDLVHTSPQIVIKMATEHLKQFPTSFLAQLFQVRALRVLNNFELSSSMLNDLNDVISLSSTHFHSIHAHIAYWSRGEAY